MSVRMLDHHMRVYTLARTRFFDHLDTLQPSLAVNAMRKDPVRMMVRNFDPNVPRQLWDEMRRPRPAAGLASAPGPHPVAQLVTDMIEIEAIDA